MTGRICGSIALVLVITGVLAAAWAGSSGRSQRAGDRSVGLEERPLIALTPTQVANLYRRNWPVYAGKCAIFEGGYIACPNYDPRYPSSLNKTPDQLIHESRRTERVSMGGGLIRPVTLMMHRDDADAVAKALPDLSVGAYGHLHSVQVTRVIGPREMEVGSPWLIDENDLDQQVSDVRAKLQRQRVPAATVEKRIEQHFGERLKLAERQKDQAWRSRIRVVGFDTSRVTANKRWTGPKGGLQMAIVKEEPPTGRYERMSTFVAVPVAAFGRGISEDQFSEMLAARDHTRERFAALVATEMEHEQEGAMERVFAALERARVAVQQREQAIEAARAERDESDRRRYQPGDRRPGSRYPADFNNP